MNAAGAHLALAITTTGGLYGWGYNGAGQLGNLSLVTTSSPVLVSGPTNTSWKSVAVGGQGHVLAITK
jgi:alpha-tubulin suppressor-like RCC1 family protein